MWPSEIVIGFADDRSEELMKQQINRLLKWSTGYHLAKDYSVENDARYSPFESQIFLECRDRTMTSPNSISNLISAVDYLDAEKIEGAFVECGVWRGGSTLAFCLATLSMDLSRREVFLYDTFEGFTETSSEDFQITDGRSASDLFNIDKNYICSASLRDVKDGIEKSGYPSHLINYVVGDVLQTIPKTLPKSIALLRLDTDYFDSTLHELQHLFPLVSSGGVVIIDDYDHWNGSRKACDEYFKSKNENVLLMRMESGRMFVKKS
jgi:hypothetical protein